MSVRFLALFVARRLVALAVLLLIISFGVFTLLYLAPGSVEQTLIGDKPSSAQTIETLREQYHLNESFFTQYWIWLSEAVRLDFGTSVRTSEPVLTAIESRMGVTLFLGGYAFIIVLLTGVPLGILAAVKKRSLIDRGVVATSVIGVSAPAFATGVFLLYVFAVLAGWFPVFGQGSGFVDRVWHLTLPALALALTGMALVLKLTRAAMVTALDQDYIVFARARGVSTRRVLVAYALRNSLVPVITAAGLLLGYLLTGAVLVEVTFALPGIGSMLIQAVHAKDVPLVQGLAMVTATIIVLVNLLSDIIIMLIDPRVRFDRVTT